MTHKKANPEHVRLLKEAGIEITWSGYTLAGDAKHPVWRFDGVKIKCGLLTFETTYTFGIANPVPEKGRVQRADSLSQDALSSLHAEYIHKAGTCDPECVAFTIAWGTFADAESYENNPDLDTFAQEFGYADKPSVTLAAFEGCCKADAFWRHIDAPALKEAFRNY